MAANWLDARREFVYSGCQWLMLILLAKLGTVEMVGAFSYALALTAPVFMLANLQLRSVQATDARGAHPFREYLAVRGLSTTVALVFALGLGLGFAPPGVWPIVALVALAKAVEALSDVVHGLLQRLERMDAIAWSMIGKGLAAVTAVSLALVAGRGLLAAVLLMFVGWATVFAAYDVPMLRRIGAAERPFVSRVARRRVGAIVSTALPLGVVMLLISLGANIPRYFIERRLGLGAVGVYSAIAYLLVAGNTVIGALGQAMTPRLAAHFSNGDRVAFQRLLWMLLAFAGGAGVLGILVAVIGGAPLLDLLYGREYSAAVAAFRWMMLAAALAYVSSALGFALTAARSFIGQAPLCASMVIATAGASAVLVPSFGINGAAMAVGAGQGVQALGAAWLLRRALAAGPRTSNR